MKKNKRIKLLENDVVEYQNNIYIYQEKEGFYFDSHNKKLPLFATNDYFEAVAAIMKIKDVYNFDSLWDIKITKNMKKNVNYINVLYWITGGVREWKQNNLYNDSWENCYKIFLENFEKSLTDINKKSNTLRECRDEIIKHLSLPYIYEFCLIENLLNK